MKFEIDDKTGIIKPPYTLHFDRETGKKLIVRHDWKITTSKLKVQFDGSSIIKGSAQTISDPDQLESLEQILQAVKKTKEKLSKQTDTGE